MSYTIKELEDRLAALEEKLRDEEPVAPHPRLVEAVFNNIYLGIRPGQPKVVIPIKMPQSPDNYECGKHYFIPASEVSVSHPWWTRV